MARLSSTSTDSDYVPVMVPFRWEVAPGVPAEQEIMDAPSLPLPPGQRPKDGFYLPYSRPVERRYGQNGAGGLNAHSRERRPFNLKFPGSSKKTSCTSQKQRKVREDTHAEGIFSPVAGHRFSSRITTRVLVEFQKRRSCLGGCLLHGRKRSLPRNHQHAGRRSGPIIGDGTYQEEIWEHHLAPTDSGSPLSSSSSHGHCRPRNSSIAGARKQSEVQLEVPGSGRFLASMLMFLCPALFDASDEAEAVDVEKELTGNIGDSFSFAGHVTMSRARVFSPGADSRSPKQGIVADPALSAMASHGDRTQAWVDMSTDLSAGLQEDYAMSNLHCEHCGNRKPQLPSICLGTSNFTSRSNQSFSFQDCKRSVADAHAVRSTEDSPSEIEFHLRPTREFCETSLSWKERNRIRAKHDLLVEPNNHEPTVFTEPRSSRGDLATVAFTTSPGVGYPPSKVNEPDSLLRRHFLEEHLEPNQPLAGRSISRLPRTLLKKQAVVTSPEGFGIKENLKASSTSAMWLELLKSSPKWPNPAPKTCIHAATDGDSSGESGIDSDTSSAESSEHETYRALSKTPSAATPERSSRVPPRKPATWAISQKLLKSSSLLKYKHQQQHGLEPPRSSFLEDIENVNTSPSPNSDFKQGDPGVVSASTSLPKLLTLNSGVMSKVAEWESNAGAGSSGKSLPIYLSRRGGMTITDKAVSRLLL